MATYTPMIQQYLKVKAEYQDAFLFYRLGDFYEMFFEDAQLASKELEIALTARGGGTDNPIPMCGVPHHAATGYIETLVSRGYKVAICEQVEDANATKGIVKREVVQLVTPGTIIEGKSLTEKENNYIACVEVLGSNTFGFAYIDLSTGEQKVAMLDSFDAVLNEISTFMVKEVVVDDNFDDRLSKQMTERGVFTVSTESESVADSPLLTNIADKNLTLTSGRLLSYVMRTQKRALDHLQPAEVVELSRFLSIDYYSKRNLELTETIRTKGKKGSLLWLLDETKTAMGGRRLKVWMERPLLNRAEIEGRHELVEAFMNNFFEREQIRDLLSNVYDLERLVGRVAFGNCNPRDLFQLKKSLQQVPAIKDTLGTFVPALAGQLDECAEIAALLEMAIDDNAPLTIKEGGVFKLGYSEALDNYKDATKNGKQWIANLEQEERELTGVKSLKIGYNRIFGYYIEITKSNLKDLDDSRYERKQTLANAERFITPKLKELETIILEAEEKTMQLEYELFVELRENIKVHITRLQALAKNISEIDCIQCFAKVSEDRRFVRPTLSKDRTLSIKAGRHPVVEKVLKAQEYVSNDVAFTDDRRLLLLTGPNMSGKSTYMRQVAHIVVLNQIGCFVPADSAELPIFDKIFTRIGAADDLISGQSTFMVEMLESRNAIVNATENSLLLFDEIGRGTSTYDGMALAQAIIEFIHDKINSTTLFSTHYHELTELSGTLERMKNIHVRAIEQNGRVVFLHKVVEGPADRSYGIHVAELAEMPGDLIKRSRVILQALESKDVKGFKTKTVEKEEFDLFTVADAFDSDKMEVLQELEKLSVMEMSPLDALNTLYALQKKLRG